MKLAGLTLCSLCLLLLSFVTPPDSAAVPADGRPERVHRLSAPGPNDVRVSASHSGASMAKAGVDSFYLYGGPDEPTEGKFQDALGVLPDRQGWIGVDLTDEPVYWQVSTFEAGNLNDHGAGNHAVWCGQSPEQKPGWGDPPGYGNSWDESLVWEGSVSDPQSGQTVSLDFYYNYDTEPRYDYFLVEYDSAGTWKTVLDETGYHPTDFAPPGLLYSESEAEPIVYDPGGYAGEDSDRVRIRFRVTSDGAWSDEDGLWPTDGAVQADDISVSWSDGSTFDDFEDGFGNWNPAHRHFAGEFSEVMHWVSDLDPCQLNDTPVMTFVDDGDSVSNWESSRWIPGYPVQTGGSISPNWSYGVPGGWVVNYSGGLSEGEVGLANAVWSPEIEWDLDPDVTDGSDDLDVQGVMLAFDRWAHLPLANGIYYTWRVRSSRDGWWTSWQDRAFVYGWDATPSWGRMERDVTNLILETPSHVQIAFEVLDLAELFQLPGNDATASPVFDNVSLMKYRLQGPLITSREIDLAHDGFPASGGIDVSTQALRDALDVPFDMAQDISVEEQPGIDPGDSIICDIEQSIPATQLDDVRMFWVLDKNPAFENGVRALPSRPKDVNVVALADQWSGEVLPDTTTTASWGSFIRVFFDLPDVDFLYPGDVLRYYVRATDDGGGVSTLPANTTGFMTGEGYDRAFTVRALPSISGADGSQPSILIWNDEGHAGGESAFLSAMGHLGFREGVDFDTYTTRGPTAGISNGLGSAGAHGATASQLAGYDTILHLTGDLGHPEGSGVLSDGSGVGVNDKSDDIGVLTAWHGQDAERLLVHFGDGLFTDLQASSAAGSAYLQNVLGVVAVEADLRDALEGQTAPLVKPVHPAFVGELIAFGGCLDLNRFDRIEPGVIAFRGHGFESRIGTVYPDFAASVISDLTSGSGHRKVAFSFPFGLRFVRDSTVKAPTGRPARARLLSEILGYVGKPLGTDPVSTPSIAPVRMTIHPNPFNPVTTLTFENLPTRSSGSVRIYNVRGELVRTLHSGPRLKSRYEWDGTDERGRSVANGVYLVEGRTGDFERVLKVALVK